MRYVLLLCGLALLPAVRTAGAQDAGRGRLVLTHWPTPERAFAPSHTLPFLDTLALDYRYGVAGDRPVLSFVLWWVPGPGGLHHGRRVPADALPPDLRLQALDVRAGVYVDGARVADLVVSVDAMALPPAPSVFAFEGVDLTWDALFDGVDAATARRFFRTGFRLRDPEVLRIAFGPGPPDGIEEPPPPAYTTVYVPYEPRGEDVTLVFRGVSHRPAAPHRPRRDAIGRQDDADDDARTRERPRDDEDDDENRAPSAGDVLGALGGGDDDEDEDDDRELWPAALGGVVAVGALAVAGGTVGYYGHPARAPLGLTSGVVRPRWGLLLHVAVNAAVLGADGPERLETGVFAFFDAFRSQVQPALGLGLWAEEDGPNLAWHPALTPGLALRLHRTTLLAGYDVGRGGLQAGLAVTFRR